LPHLVGRIRHCEEQRDAAIQYSNLSKFLKPGLPRRVAPRNDEKMLSQVLFTKISSKKKIRRVVSTICFRGSF
ncbi:MAG: hypothetical protein LBJ96_00930, partial [Holosporaceae bacterium]|nr:hypothetical protein [Holosporaceae bacterium]